MADGDGHRAARVRRRGLGVPRRLAGAGPGLAEDPDDWLVYAMVANSGTLIVGLGTQSRPRPWASCSCCSPACSRSCCWASAAASPASCSAAAGVALLLSRRPGRPAWRGSLACGGSCRSWPARPPATAPVPFGAPAHLALLAASAMLFAAALRRWSAPPDPVDASARRDIGGERAVVLLIGFIIVLAFAPQFVSGARLRALRHVLPAGRADAPPMATPTAAPTLPPAALSRGRRRSAAWARR
ncbi:MAG: hypothetical protein U0470_02515 [Anaerolineae bacterium]